MRKRLLPFFIPLVIILATLALPSRGKPSDPARPRPAPCGCRNLEARIADLDRKVSALILHGAISERELACVLDQATKEDGAPGECFE